MQSEKLKRFFETHPDVDVVYSALGVLFLEPEKAKKYLAGVPGQSMQTFTREKVATTDDKELEQEKFRIAAEDLQKKIADDKEAAKKALDEDDVQKAILTPGEAEKKDADVTDEKSTDNKKKKK